MCLGNVYYGWVVVLVAAIIRILVYGISYTSGVVYVIILENFETGAAETSWISSLITAMTFFITPLAGVLVNQLGWRVVTFCGGLLTCGGLLLSTLSTNLVLLCLFYGVITGAGCGISYMSGSIAVPTYFHQKKIQNLAVGLASAGGGIGSFVFPPIVRFLNNEYGWKGMFMMMGGLSLHICVFGLLYRPLPNTDQNENSIKKKGQPASSHVPEPNDWTFLKSLVFHFISINNVLFSFGSSIIYGHLAAYAKFHLHINDNDAAFLYSIIGISITIAKISQGLIADFHKVHPIFKAINQYIIFYLIGGFATSFLLVVTGYGGLLVYCILFGASNAANGGSLIPAILIELFGPNKLSLPYAVVLAQMSIGQILGAPVAGWMYDSMKNYHYPFLLASASMTVSAIIMVYPRHYLTRPREEKTIIIIDIESPQAQEIDRFSDEVKSKGTTHSMNTCDKIKEEEGSMFLQTDAMEDQQTQDKIVSERTSLITTVAEEKRDMEC
ncbi:monocarboxylate transporter 13-like [Saccostrea cucullata]|uniref:monocarboxylate transporter 13-like n=1 Tax=Saccostrea cuccullata TaxID=36930 RepID=UPI002ED27404